MACKSEFMSASLKKKSKKVLNRTFQQFSLPEEGSKEKGDESSEQSEDSSTKELALARLWTETILTS